MLEDPPLCPERDDYGWSWFDEGVCAAVPAVEEEWYSASLDGVDLLSTIASTEGQEVPLGTPLQIVDVSTQDVREGVWNRWVKVRAADGKEGFVFGADLSPYVGKAWSESIGIDVPWALHFSDRGLVFEVGGPEPGSLILRYEGELSGAVSMKVERWGDMEPLFKIRVCPDNAGSSATEPCPWAAVTIDGFGPVQLNKPGAYRHPPTLLDDDPDCDTAAPVTVAETEPELVLTLQLPHYKGEVPLPASCMKLGQADQPHGAFILCSSADRQVAFVETSPKEWQRLTCGSDPMLELDLSLQLQGVQVVENGTASWSLK